MSETTTTKRFSLFDMFQKESNSLLTIFARIAQFCLSLVVLILTAVIIPWSIWVTATLLRIDNTLVPPSEIRETATTNALNIEMMRGQIMQQGEKIDRVRIEVDKLADLIEALRNGQP